MRKKVNSGLMAGASACMVLAVLWVSSASLGGPVSDREAMAITGGQGLCGYTWVGGNYSCAAGTAYCKTAPDETAECSTYTIRCIVSSGSCSYVCNSPASSLCYVCGTYLTGTTCNYVTPTTSTHQCNGG
jgi:hypothetical protein